MKIEEEYDRMIDEIINEFEINIDYNIKVRYKENIFEIGLEEEDKAELENIIINRAWQDYGGIMETLYDIDKAES